MGHNRPVPAASPAVKPRNPRRTSAESVLSNARRAARHDGRGKVSAYAAELCEHAIALGNKGQTYSEIAVAFGVSRKTLWGWARDHDEFKEALDRARDGMQAWWEAHGRKNLKAKHYQANVARIILGANLEDYREKPKPISSELVDFLSAVVDGAAERQAKRLPAGSDAKVIEGEASSLPLGPVPVKRKE